MGSQPSTSRRMTAPAGQACSSSSPRIGTSRSTCRRWSIRGATPNALACPLHPGLWSVTPSMQIRLARATCSLTNEPQSRPGRTANSLPLERSQKMRSAIEYSQGAEWPAPTSTSLASSSSRAFAKQRRIPSPLGEESFGYRSLGRLGSVVIPLSHSKPVIGNFAESWWAMQGLNLRLIPCEGITLPLS